MDINCKPCVYACTQPWDHPAQEHHMHCDQVWDASSEKKKEKFSWNRQGTFCEYECSRNRANAERTKIKHNQIFRCREEEILHPKTEKRLNGAGHELGEGITS